MSIGSLSDVSRIDLYEMTAFSLTSRLFFLHSTSGVVSVLSGLLLNIAGFLPFFARLTQTQELAIPAAPQ